MSAPADALLPVSDVSWPYPKNYFSHSSPTGTSSSQRVTAQGYAWSRVGENIARGQPTPFTVVEGWLRSSGHCTNILGAYTEIGVGVSTAKHWVQSFGVQQGQQTAGGTGPCPSSLNRSATESAVPAPSPTPAPAAPPGTGAVAAPEIRKVKAQGSKRRKLRVSVRCPAGRPACIGTVRIRMARKGDVIGRRTFEIPSGKTRPVSVTLTRSGNRRLRRADRRAVYVQLVSKGAPSSGAKAKVGPAR